MSASLRRALWFIGGVAIIVAISCRSTRSPQKSPSADTATYPKAPAAATPTTAPDSAPRIVLPFEGVTVFPELHEVRIDAVTCLTEGYLEQVACAPNTREHESLVVTRVKPSQIHAALLMAGFEPGTPGQWRYENDSYSVVPPQGDPVDVLVICSDPQGRAIEQPISKWVREKLKDGTKPLGNEPWVFGGSRFDDNPEFMGVGEHYVADMTGSIIGLVTFGDEVIGYSRVLADQEDVQEPVFEVNTDAVPAEGTNVTVILRRPAAKP
jgi:hypothetical protein